MIAKQTAVIAVGTESTYGTAATLSATDAFFGDFSHTILDGNVATRNNITGMMGAQGSIRTDQYSSMDLTAELAGSGTAGTAPRWGKTIKACGFNETVVATTSVTYAPISANFGSATIGAFYKDKAGAVTKAQVTGARGSFTIDVSAGSIPTIAFKMQGLYSDPATATALTGTFTGIPVPQGVNDANTTALTFFGESLSGKKVTIDAGIKANYSNLINAESVDITGRESKLSVSFRADSVAQLNTWMQRAKENAQGAFNVVHGTNAGNIVTINVPNVQINKVDASYDGDIMFINVEADIVPTTANSDFTIALT